MQCALLLFSLCAYTCLYRAIFGPKTEKPNVLKPRAIESYFISVKPKISTNHLLLKQEQQEKQHQLQIQPKKNSINQQINAP